MSERSPHLVAGMALLAIGLAASAYIIADSVRDFKRANDTITVTGSAKRPIRSDFIIWRGTVATRKATRQAAYAQLQQYTERVREYLHEKNIADSTLTFRSISTYPVYQFTSNGRRTENIRAYNMSQTFEIRSHEVDSMLVIIEDANRLITEGLPFVSANPEFLYTGLDELRVEMLGAAAANARERASQLAQSLDCEIGVVRNVQMGVFQITRRYSTEVSGYGINDTSSLEKDITAVVRVTFSVN